MPALCAGLPALVIASIITRCLAHVCCVGVQFISTLTVTPVPVQMTYRLTNVNLIPYPCC
eukprot:scaffold190874_cov21-Tisochrysis_lutea.AAC.2